jgi:plasmid stabilization system protein ParE
MGFWRKSNVTPLPFLHLMPRVSSDIEECFVFIGRQPWGKPADRKRDILAGIARIRRNPRLARVEASRPATGVELRRHRVAQFTLIYAYFPPNDVMLNGIVSIRAIRHRRVKNVFWGVKQPPPPQYGKTSINAADDLPQS